MLSIVPAASTNSVAWTRRLRSPRPAASSEARRPLSGSNPKPRTVAPSQISGPSDLYRTRDGFVLVSVVGQPLFRRWVRLMQAEGVADGEPDWLGDPRFATDDLRGEHGEVIGARMQRWCAERDRDDVVRILGDAMIPCGPVLSPQQALDHPQVAALGLLQDTDYPGLPSPAPIAAVPLWMSATPPVARRRPPTIGEHTDELLTELGYDAASIADLRARAVV